MNKKFLLLLSLSLFINTIYGAVQIKNSGTKAARAAYYEVKGFTLALRKAKRKILTAEQKRPVIHIGDTARAKELKLTSDRFAPDTWQIKSVGSEIFINGSGRGLFYATAIFLERFLNVRYFSSFETFIPLDKDIIIPPIDISGKPHFEYRHVFRRNRGRDSGRFAVRRRLNNEDTGRIADKFGGALAFGPPRFVHTMWSYIPHHPYFAKHPDYFALVKGERRPGREGQLCLTHPDLPEIFYRTLLKYIASGEASAKKYNSAMPVFYDISINDNNNRCECPRCKEAEKKFGCSGILLNFLNRIAAKLAKSHPHLKLTTLAYLFNEAPPKGDIRAADNVIVRLCPRINMGSSFMSPENAAFRDTVKQWSKRCKNLFIWDYSVTYIAECIGLPFPSELYYGERFRFYADNGVRGIMFEHPFEPEADLFELKFFMECRLMENPYADAGKLMKDFCRDYYGAAADDILASRKVLAAAYNNSKANIKYMSPIKDFSYIDAASLSKCHALYDRAEKAVAADPEKFSRVRRARRGLDRLTLRYAMPPIQSSENKKFQRPAETADALKRLQQSWKKHLERYPDKDKLQLTADFEMQCFEAASKCRPDLPEKFAGRKFYDYLPFRFQNHAPGAVKLVADPQSQCGYAMEIDVAKDKLYSFPFDFGFRDRYAKKTHPVRLDKPPVKRGYQWYKIGTFTMPGLADIFFSRAWSVKLHLSGMPASQKFEMYASFCFAGQSFYPADKGIKDVIRINRVVLIPVK